MCSGAILIAHITFFILTSNSDCEFPFFHGVLKISPNKCKKIGFYSPYFQNTRVKGEVFRENPPNNLGAQ